MSVDAISKDIFLLITNKCLCSLYQLSKRIPAEIVEEYGIADVVATEQVALKQLEAFGLTFEELYETNTETVVRDDEHAI